MHSYTGRAGKQVHSYTGRAGKQVHSYTQAELGSKCTHTQAELGSKCISASRLSCLSSVRVQLDGLIRMCSQTESEIKYEAESPDEAALVVAAKVMGFFFYARNATSITVRDAASACTAYSMLRADCP